MTLYLADVCDLPLLTRSEEYALGVRMDMGRRQAMRSFLRSSASVTPLAELAQQASHDPRRAATMLAAAPDIRAGAFRDLARQVERIRRSQRRRERLWLELSRESPSTDSHAVLTTKLARLSQRQFHATEKLPLAPEIVGQLITGFARARRPAPDPADVVAVHLYAEASRALEGIREGEALRRRAAETFVRANVRLVLKIARRYASCGYELEDLIQEGNIGLMRAVDRFDHTRGFRFSTYGTHWIRQAIVRGIANRARLIRVPVHLHQRWTIIAGAMKELAAQTGREPSLGDVASHLELPLDRVESTLSAFQRPASLDAPIQDQTGASFARALADDDAPSPFDQTAAGELQRAAHVLLATLSGREAYVLRMRFGIGAEAPATLASIGARLGVTRERARQIEAAALEKLRLADDPAALRQPFGSGNTYADPAGREQAGLPG